MSQPDIHPVDLHVGRRLRDLRGARKLSQSDLAAALGLSFQQVQKYERGANRVSASKLWAASQFFDVDINVFFDGFDGVPMREGPGVPHALSRETPEIARLSPRLTLAQQRLALNIMKTMLGHA